MDIGLIQHVACYWLRVGNLVQHLCQWPRWRHREYPQQVADDTNLGGIADTLEGCATVQQDLNKLENWAGKHLMRFNKNICKVPHLRRNNHLHQYQTAPQSKKDMGLLEGVWLRATKMIKVFALVFKLRSK